MSKKLINHDFDMEFYSIESENFTSLPVMYKFLYKLSMDFSSRIKQEAFEVDFYSTNYFVPLKNHYKPISKIINFNEKIVFYE